MNHTILHVNYRLEIYECQQAVQSIAFSPHAFCSSFKDEWEHAESQVPLLLCRCQSIQVFLFQWKVFGKMNCFHLPSFGLEERHLLIILKLQLNHTR